MSVQTEHIYNYDTNSVQHTGMMDSLGFKASSQACAQKKQRKKKNKFDYTLWMPYICHKWFDKIN